MKSNEDAANSGRPLSRADTLCKAVDVFDALERCIHRNFADDQARYDAEDFILHKFVWSLTVDNAFADLVLSDLRKRRVLGDRMTGPEISGDIES